MYRLVIVFLVCLLLLPGMASAQDGDELQCSDPDIGTAIDMAITQLQEAKSQEASAALASIVAVKEMLAELDAQCLGLTFSGTTDTVHGPLYVPEGIYRVSVTTLKSFDMELLVLDGDCGDGRGVFWTDFYDGEFTVETVFESKGCSALFETHEYGGPYTVTFEKIR